MRKTSLSLLIIILFFLPFEAQAGWVISRLTTDEFGNKSYQTVFIEDTLMRFETPSSISIFNLPQHKITLIFGQHQAYWQGSASQLRRQIFEIADRQMQELIAHAPSGQQDTLRKMYEVVRKKREESLNDTTLSTLPNVSVEKTAHTATMLGYPAQLYQVRVDSVLVENLWVTHAVDPYKNLDIKSMIGLMGALEPANGKAWRRRSLKYDNLLYHGLVLKRIQFLADGRRRVSMVKNVRKVNIKETIFEIPANYVETKIQEVMLQDIKQNILNPASVSSGQENQNMLSLPPPFKVPGKQQQNDQTTPDHPNNSPGNPNNPFNK